MDFCRVSSANLVNCSFSFLDFVVWWSANFAWLHLWRFRLTSLHIQKRWNYLFSYCFIQRHQKAWISFCTSTSWGVLLHAATLTVTYPSDASLAGSKVLYQHQGQVYWRQTGRSPEYSSYSDGWACLPFSYCRKRKFRFTEVRTWCPEPLPCALVKLLLTCLFCINNTFCLQSWLKYQTKLWTATCHVI